MESGSQKSWQAIAAAIRAQISDLVPLMAAMKPDELKQFVDVAREALWLEQSAAYYDKDVDLKQARVVWGDD